MKVIDLDKRTIYVDDIQQIYRETNYSPERYNIQTINGTYIVSKEDYFKVKEYLLSLNDEVEIIEEAEKIEKIEQRTDTGLFGSMVNDEIKVAEAINKQANYLSEIVSKINEIIDYLEEKKNEKE